MTMKKLHEHYHGAVEQTVAGLIQLAAEAIINLYGIG